MDGAFEIGLLTILVRLQSITQEDAVAIERAYNDSDVDQFDDFLLQEGNVDKRSLLVALSEYYQVPSFDVEGYFFERQYVSMFPQDVLLRHSMIPLEVDESSMVMIASRPDNPELLFDIGQSVSYDIQFYVGIGRDINDAIKEFYDKSDTEIDEDEQNEGHDEEMLLSGEFHLLDEEGEEISFALDDEEDFE